jgi:RND family efflux transporter MFP subunit
MIMKITAFSAIALFWSAATLAQPTITVETDKVESEYIAATTSVSGVVVSREDAAIASELNGKLIWIADVGERLSAGEPLAVLDAHLMQLEKRNQEAEVLRLQANLEWFSRQSRRLNKLANQNNTARSELDEVESRQLMLEQELAQAQVNLERAIYNLERTTIRAPFDGIVVSREASVGEFAVTGRPLLRLVNTETAEISVTAPLRLARFIKPGDSVTVSNQDSQGMATVRNLIPVGDSRSHMMELRISLLEEDLFIGEAVTVALPASRQSQLTTIARDAVVLRDHSNYVYVIEEDNIARRVTVELGSGLGERIAVLGDLQVGDEVVIRGAERLKDGQLVERRGQRISMR